MKNTIVIKKNYEFKNFFSKGKFYKGKFINMHTHTTRCQHASGADEEYVIHAIEAGLDVLGFSDHSPYLLENEYVSPIRMSEKELDGYVDQVLSLKKAYKKWLCDGNATGGGAGVIVFDGEKIVN